MHTVILALAIGCTVDCTDGNGDEEGCSAAAPSCAFRKLAFRDAFPEWWERQHSGECSVTKDTVEAGCTRA